MLSSTTIWVTFALYICFLLSVAAYVTVRDRKRKDGGNLLTATVPWPVLIMTYLASLMSTWVFFAGPGAYYRNGLGYWVAELSYICLFPVISHFTMNKIWAYNQQKGRKLITPSDFYYERFKSPALRTILGLVFLACSFPYIASVLVAISQAAQYATGGAISYANAVVVIGITMTVFVCIGGMKSAAFADTIQGLFFIAALWIIAISCLVVGFHGSLNEALQTIWRNPNTAGFFSYPGPSGTTTYAFRFGYPFSCAIGWTIMLPHVFVRSGYFGNSLHSQRRLSFATPVLQVFVWTGTMLIGLIGLALVDRMTSSESELIIPYLINNIVFDANPPLAVFLMLTFFVGATAVGLSTANAFLGVSSAIVESDLLKNTFHLNITPKSEKIIGRIIIIILGTTSTLIAINPPQLIFTLIMFSIALVMPLFPVMVCALYWKHATKQAAIAATLVGTALVIMTYAVWDMGNVWYGTIGLLASTVVMIVVSLITYQDNKETESFYTTLEDAMNRFYTIDEK